MNMGSNPNQKRVPRAEPVIAVDGPAASGKGTIARALAAHYGLPHMDTGLLYRAAALNLWRWGGDPGNEFEAVRAAQELNLDAGDPELRSEPVSKIASSISAYPQVRAALLQRQQDFAGQPGGAVLDGRDIGTVIAPDADVKLFVTATAGSPRPAPDARARRPRHARALRRRAGRHPRPRRARFGPRAPPRCARRRTRFGSTRARWTSRKPSPPRCGWSRTGWRTPKPERLLHLHRTATTVRSPGVGPWMDDRP